MKKYTSFILIIALSLWAICSGFSNAHAGEEPVALSDMPLETVDAPFETPTDLVSFGDITEDRVINAKDALWVLKAAVCKCIIPLHQELIADVTRDGMIDAKDALEMLKYAVGKPNAIQPMEIKLQTIYGDTYTANTLESKQWKTALATGEISYGIKTNVQAIDPETAVDTFVRAVMAGKVETDLMEVNLPMSRNIARKKVAANLYDSQTLNKNKYKNGATQSVTLGGKAYGVSLGDQSGMVTGILYNKNLIQQYAPNVDLQDLYLTKQWTFDAFKALAKQCTVDLDEDTKPDIYGVTSNYNIVGMAISANTGGYALLHNDRVQAVFCNDDGLDGVLWCKNLYKEDSSWRYRANIKESVELFAQGEAAMLATYAFMAGEVAKIADFEMGFLPMPIGPAQTDYITPVYDARVYVMPKTNIKRLSQVGIWLNSIAQIREELVAFHCEQFGEYGVDEQGVEVYKYLMENTTPDYSTGALSSNVVGWIENLSGLTDQRLQAIRNLAQQELDEYYAPFYE